MAECVLPSLVVHELAQQLNWWLSTILLHLRHVEIIHQNDLLLAQRWAVHTLAPLLQLTINDVLQCPRGNQLQYRQFVRPSIGSLVDFEWCPVAPLLGF